MAVEHFQIGVVALPLMAAPIIALLGRSKWAHALTLAVAIGAAFMSWVLLAQVLSEGPMRYRLGNWPAPWGIEYRLDIFGAIVQTLVATLAAVMMPHLQRLLALEIPPARIAPAMAAFLLLLSGLLGIVATGDAFNVFVFLEISSLSTYALIALGRRREALVASFRYLIVGTVGATFFLIGVGLLYIMTGTLNMDDLAIRLPAISQSASVQTAIAFVVLGLAIKAALFPLHFWLPAAYSEAPSAIGAFLAATSTKVALYALARFLFGVFPLADLPLGEGLLILLQSLAVLAMLVGSALAINQTDLRRLLAFSSIAQIGYIVLGLSLASLAGLTAATIHIVNHALMKAALFMAVGAMAYQTGSASLKSLRGLGHRMPITGASLVIAGFSLVGVPLTAGFISKWWLISALIEQQHWMWMAAVLASSVLSVIYFWKIVETLYERTDAVVERCDPSVMIWGPIVILALANLWLGVDAGALVETAGRGAEWLLGMTPAAPIASVEPVVSAIDGALP